MENVKRAGQTKRQKRADQMTRQKRERRTANRGNADAENPQLCLQEEVLQLRQLVKNNVPELLHLLLEYQKYQKSETGIGGSVLYQKDQEFCIGEFQISWRIWVSQWKKVFIRSGESRNASSMHRSIRYQKRCIPMRFCSSRLRGRAGRAG